MLSPGAKVPANQPEYPPVLNYNGRLYQFQSQIEWFKDAVTACNLGQVPPPMPTERPVGDKLVPIRDSAAQLGVGRRTVGRYVKKAADQRAKIVAAE